MAPVADRAGSPATGLAYERLMATIDADLAGDKILYPRGAIFVSTEIEDVGKVLTKAALERRPVVLVYPDGTERLVVPREVDQAKLVIAFGLLVAGAVAVLRRLRPRMPI